MRPTEITPDGLYYLDMMQGKPVPMPYASRVLIPTLAGLLGGVIGFKIIAVASLALTILFYSMSLDLLGYGTERILLASSLFLLFPWVGHFMIRFMILTDAPAAACTAIGMYACLTNDFYLFCLAITLAVIIREFIVILLLAMGLMFWPLWFTIPMLAWSIVMYWVIRGQLNIAPVQDHQPFSQYFGPPLKVMRTCWSLHRKKWFNPLSTWGVMFFLAIIGLLHAPDPVLKMWPMLVVAYWQPLLGTDYERLQAQAWPVVLTLAVSI